jgi:hypothetical protein
VVEHRLAQQLHRIAGQEERDLVPAVDRCLADEEAEGGARRMLGPVRDVDQELCHAGIISERGCR